MMSPWLLLLLGSTLLLYLLVVLPLTRDEVPFGKVVVVAPTLTATLEGPKRKRVDALVRRWERGCPRTCPSRCCSRRSRS